MKEGFSDWIAFLAEGTLRKAGIWEAVDSEMMLTGTQP